MAGFIAYSTSRPAESSAHEIQTQLRNLPLLITATVGKHSEWLLRTSHLKKSTLGKFE